MKGIVKSKVIILIVLSVLASFLVGCAKQQETTSELKKITLGQSGSVCQAALLMAYEKGFLEEAGFEVTLFKGDYPTLRDGLATGKVDVTDGLLMSWLKPVESGLDLVFTTGIHTGCLAAVSLKNSGYNSFSDLKGKVIGVSGGIGGVPMNFAYRAILKEGLNPEDFEWRDYPAQQLITALENGEIQAAITTEQVSLNWVDEGKVDFIRSSTHDHDFSGEYCCLLTFRGGFLRNDPESAEAITKAVMKAAEWVQDNKEETVDILLEKGHISGTREYALELLEGFNYNPSVQGGKSAIDIAIKEFKETGILNNNTNEKELADRIFKDFSK